MQHARRRAFTLIELLVVIGVLIILAGILILGTNSVMGGAKAKSTKVALASATGLLAELDAKTRLSKPPAFWLWTGVTGAVVAGGDVDFWRIPFRDPMDPLRNPDALDAPGAVSDAAVSRGGSKAVCNTQMIMAVLLSLPSNKAAMDKLGQESQLVPEWVAGSSATLRADGTVTTEDVYYILGAKVKNPVDGKIYTCTVAHASPTGSNTPDADATNWGLSSSNASPLLLDGWHNPIIFVPGTGLRVMHTNGKRDYDPSDSSQLFIDMSPEGKTTRNASNKPYVTQAGRPFFASAGPDGDFMKGDDNIYSYQP